MQFYANLSGNKRGLELLTWKLVLNKPSERQEDTWQGSLNWGPECPKIHCFIVCSKAAWALHFTLIRKILVSVKFLSAIRGPEMAAPILWTPGKMRPFCRKTNVHKIPRFLGGGILGFGGGSADYIFMGARIFLIPLKRSLFQKNPSKVINVLSLECHAKFFAIVASTARLMFTGFHEAGWSCVAKWQHCYILLFETNHRGQDLRAHRKNT